VSAGSACDVLWLEAEVRRDGHERGAAAEGAEGLEPSVEVACCGADDAQSLDTW